MYLPRVLALMTCIVRQAPAEVFAEKGMALIFGRDRTVDIIRELLQFGINSTTLTIAEDTIGVMIQDTQGHPHLVKELVILHTTNINIE